MEPLKLRTMDEAAEMLRKTPAQMRWLRNTKAGPKSAKIGGRIMYKESDIIDWVNAQFDAEASA